MSRSSSEMAYNARRMRLEHAMQDIKAKWWRQANDNGIRTGIYEDDYGCDLLGYDDEGYDHLGFNRAGYNRDGLSFSYVCSCRTEAEVIVEKFGDKNLQARAFSGGRFFIVDAPRA